jgi:tetratricopeptide (TPR) repeat protein
MAGIRNNLGMYYYAGGKLNEAEAHWSAALSIWKELAASLPGTDVTGGVATTSNNLAESLHWTGRLDRADEMYQSAQAAFDSLAQAAANDFAGRFDSTWKMTTVCLNRAHLEIERGRLQRAAELLSLAVERMKPFARQEPRLHELSRFVWVLACRASVYGRLGDATRARSDWKRVVEAAQRMGTKDVAADQALALAHLGEWQKALALAGDSTKPVWKRALVYAVSSEQATRDAGLSSQERKRRTMDLMDGASALMRQAYTQGELNDGDVVIELRVDTEFAPLRSRPELRDVVEQVERRPGEPSKP